MTDSSRFGRDYYERYYRSPQTRVADRSYFDALAGLIHAQCVVLDYEVGSILDLGAGIGTMRTALRRYFPRASYTGTEISRYACQRYGWEQVSVCDYTSADQYDLVVCSDVLQYLDDRRASQAIRVFTAVASGLMYFSTLTSEDWEQNCDQSLTDGDVHLRNAQWYRRRLRRDFKTIGNGLYLHRACPVVTYALEAY